MSLRPSDATETTVSGSGAAPRWRRVLVLHIGSFGDTVLSVPALAALRAHVGPTATITLLHDDGASGRVSPSEIIPAGLVDDEVAFRGPVPPPDPGASRARGRAAARRAIGTLQRAVAVGGTLLELRRRRFDVVVNLTLGDRPPGTLRRDRAFFRLAGIDDQVGFDARPPGAPEAEVRLARLQRAGIRADLGDGPWLIADPPARAEAEAWRAGAGLGAGQPIATIAPATLMSAKRWPLDRWAAIGTRLRDLGLEPVVVGGPADRAEGDQLVAAWAGGANAAGALTPAGSAALMASAELHIGVDTGTTHVAAASGTPVVALYSHRAPIRQWAPMGSGHQIVDHPVPCAGCLAIECPVPDHPCMTGIAPDDVWVRVQTAYARAGNP